MIFKFMELMEYFDYVKSVLRLSVDEGQVYYLMIFIWCDYKLSKGWLLYILHTPNNK